MPLYEYRCPECQGRFEVIQHLGASAAETACPTCGGKHVERQFSTFAMAGGGSGSGSKSAAAESFAGCGGGQCGMSGGCGGGDWN